MLYCGCVGVTMLCPTVKFISSTTKMLKIPEVLCRVSEMSVVTLQCLQFYRRLSEEITQRRWENMPTGQTIQVNKDPQVCVELLSSNLVSTSCCPYILHLACLFNQHGGHMWEFSFALPISSLA